MYFYLEIGMDKNKIVELLEEIPDPEIPVISIVELGVIRNVETIENKIVVTITPTYSGCPAMKQMQDDVIKKLKEAGYTDVEVKTTYSPAWTTDWINEEAKEKLRRYGIAPPEHSSIDKKTLMGIDKIVKCPRCKSTDTRMVSQFGSTACKALYQCKDCLEPFDFFKCI